MSLVLHGKIIYKVGVKVVAPGAMKLIGYLREQMQQRNQNFTSLYTVRALKEVSTFLSIVEVS